MFLRRPGVISSHVCGNWNSYFNPKPWFYPNYGQVIFVSKPNQSTRTVWCQDKNRKWNLNCLFSTWRDCAWIYLCFAVTCWADIYSGDWVGTSCGTERHWNFKNHTEHFFFWIIISEIRKKFGHWKLTSPIPGFNINQLVSFLPYVISWYDNNHNLRSYTVISVMLSPTSNTQKRDLCWKLLESVWYLISG